MTNTRALRLVPAIADHELAGVDHIEVDVTGDQLLRLWAQWMRAAGSTPKTIKTRVEGVTALATHSGQPDPTGFTETQLVAWLADCRSQWTRCTYWTSARRWHGWLVEHGYRGDDPTARLPKQRWPSGAPRPVSDAALTDALAVASRRARAYVLLGGYQGLRVHEIAKVRGEDFADGWLYVTGKGDKPAALPVHHLVDQLRRGWPGRGYWFPGADAGHVRGASITTTVTATFRRAGHDYSAHQLRHTYATELLRSGADLRTTQELMRHQSLTSTQVYTQVADAAKVAAVGRLGAGRRSAGSDTPGRPDPRRDG